jgi:hypothetical protein
MTVAQERYEEYDVKCESGPRLGPVATKLGALTEWLKVADLPSADRCLRIDPWVRIPHAPPSKGLNARAAPRHCY